MRGTVGGVQGILGILQAVSMNTMSRESAISTMIEIYGFNEATANKILGSQSKEIIINKQKDEKSEIKPL